MNIFESINNRRHKRSIRSISDYYILLCSYIEKETPNPIELWELEEAIEVFTAYKEASATDNK
ncbi:hypothetical protein F1C14_11195 [Clostridium perfringens]|nr:hypothetical protein F1C14_11195 [Clostridium perfringens]